MPKRKAVEVEDLETGPMEKSRARRDSAGSYNTQQKNAIAEFAEYTNNKDQKAAAKILKQHNFNVQAAVNAKEGIATAQILPDGRYVRMQLRDGEIVYMAQKSYFSNPQNNASNPIRATMSKTFDKYRESPNDEPDEINVEGTSKLLADMDISLEDIGSLVFSELVQSPSLGKITREGFLEGVSDVGADNLAKLRTVIVQRRSSLSTDKNIFKNVYIHTFTLALQPNQKAVQPEMALGFWQLLFSRSGYEWRTAHVPWLDWWCEYQEEKYKKAVNKDLWRQTLAFAERTMKDESLSFWSEESSWPSVIDDFVGWVKDVKWGGKGVSGSDDAMDVE